MTKIAIVTDTHFGGRNDSGVFAKHMRSFYDNLMFPYMKKHNIQTLFHLGDTFDRRRYINYKTLHDCKDYFFNPLRDNNIDVHMLVGNHDTFYKNTNNINADQLLLQQYDNIHIYHQPEEVNVPALSSQPFVMLPWICQDNHDQAMELISKTQCQLLFGHLEISGFEPHVGYYHDSGFSSKIFNKFDMVMSGHFHHKSDNGTIYYLGVPYEMTWQDYNDQKGFHVFDFDTRELEFIPNPVSLYHKYYYNDANMTFEDLNSIDFSSFKNGYVKVVVQEKNDPYLFDVVLDKMYDSGVFDVTIVENFIDVECDEEMVDEAQDTLTILSQYINNLNVNVDKKTLDIFIQTLYNESLSIT
jgi:DNA repair exonuclease SbcCD nuclease subunit